MILVTKCECTFSIDIFSFKYIVLIGPNHFEVQHESEWMQNVTYILYIRSLSQRNTLRTPIDRRIRNEVPLHNTTCCHSI